MLKKYPHTCTNTRTNETGPSVEVTAIVKTVSMWCLGKKTNDRTMHTVLANITDMATRKTYGHIIKILRSSKTTHAYL